jgi:vacuolar-type H+-ATPase subunit C/Vma6
MTYAWEAAAARARGLATHLLGPRIIAEVERAASPAEVAGLLRDTPYARFLSARDASAGSLEVAITRSLSDRMAALARWCDPAALAPVFLEQDMRNLRALLRGVLGGTSTEQRLAGVIPTPTLDRRSLTTLAAAESPGALAGTLTAWGHPLGSALLEGAKGARPDGYRIEAALARGLARATTSAARRGGAHMVGFVAESLDVHNAMTALLLAGARTEAGAAALFVEGGERLSREDFVRAASTPDRTSCAGLLAKATRGSDLSRPLAELPASPGATAARILDARIESLGRKATLDPLSPLPVLLFVLRLRREARLVRHATWAAALSGRRRAP